MKALRYVHQRPALLAGFVTGILAFPLVYFLATSGSSSPAPQVAASIRGIRGPALANAIRHRPGLIHVSESCGGAKPSTNGHVVITRSKGGGVCAQGGTMYSELVAMHTPRAEIIRMLVSSKVTQSGMTQSGRVSTSARARRAQEACAQARH
jgi:hypothetical protein